MESLQSRLIKFGLRRLVDNRNVSRETMVAKRRFNVHYPKKRSMRPCTASPMTLSGVLTHEIAPPKPHSPTVLLYLHGGAFVSGPLWVHWRLLRKLCLELNCVGYLPDYRKAPEYTCREGVADVEAVYHAVRERHPDHKIVVLGDSAGGNLSLVLAQRLRDRQQPLPHKLGLLAPALDATFKNPKIPSVAAKDPMLSLSLLKKAAELWSGDCPLDDPMLSPINADLSGLPPMHLQIGTADILWPDCQLFRDKAHRAGAQLDYLEAEAMVHVWTAAPMLPEARRAVKALVQFIR